jgi:hypothetical protein
LVHGAPPTSTIAVARPKLLPFTVMKPFVREQSIELVPDGVQPVTDVITGGLYDTSCFGCENSVPPLRRTTTSSRRPAPAGRSHSTCTELMKPTEPQTFGPTNTLRPASAKN